MFNRKEYYQKNKEKDIKYKKKWHLKNKERIKEQRKEYYSKPEVIARRKKYSEQYNKKNKDKIKEKQRKYREENIKELKEKRREFREKNKEILIKPFNGKCQKCGYNKCISALEFHHKNPKEKEMNIDCEKESIEKLLEEIKKCILLCANCHRELHYSDIKETELENWINSGLNLEVEVKQS